MVQRTITVDIPENMDKLLENVARLLLYPSAEAFLEKEAVKWTLSELLGNFEVFVDPDELKKRYSLEEDFQETETTQQNLSPAAQVPNKSAIVEELERTTDWLSLCMRDKAFETFLVDNVVIRRVLSDVQQTLVELKGSLQFPEDTVKITLPLEAMNLLTEEAQALGKTPEQVLQEIILRKVGACPVKESAQEKLESEASQV